MIRTHIRGLVGLVIGLAMLAGCTSDERPDDVIPEAEMAVILKDMQLAYTGIDHTVRNPKDRNAKYQEMNVFVLKKHSMDKEKFYDSYAWYEQRPYMMDTVFKLVIEGLNEELKVVKEQRGAPVPMGRK